MGQSQSMRKCKACGRQTMHIQNKPSHVLHLLLSVFTLGLWLIVWLLVSLSQGPPQCTVCGKKVGLFGT